MEDKDKFYNECSCCFLQWEALIKVSVCDYCINFTQRMEPSWREQRFNRMLKVMNTASVHRFPEIIKLMSYGLRWDENQ